MTILIIGGAYQGKTAYAQTELGLSAPVFADGEKINADGYIRAEHVNRLHLFIMSMLKDGKSQDDIVRLVSGHVNGKVVICDDICGGIIPMDAFERDYRETVGRALCEAVKAADVVIRVQCGLGQILKGRL